MTYLILQKKIKVHVIGIGVDADTRAYLSKISSSGGGLYYDANNTQTLSDSLKAIEQLERPQVLVEELKPLGGSPIELAGGFSNAVELSRYYFGDNSDGMRLENHLAPGQFTYLKLERSQLSIYQEEQDGKSTTNNTLKISLKLFGDRTGVAYDTTTNTFKESNLHNFKLQVYSEDSWPVGPAIEVRDANMFKQDYYITLPKPICCEYDYDRYYVKIGSEDFGISKYDVFYIEPGLDASTVSDTENPNEDEEGEQTPFVINWTYVITAIVGVVILGLVVIIFRIKRRMQVPQQADVVHTDDSNRNP